MDKIIVLLIIFGIFEIYFLTVGIVSIREMYHYHKDGNKRGTNLRGRMLKKGIEHELVHARIANMFGFTDWKIISKIDELVCRINIDYDILNWKSLFGFLRMCIFHFIFDVGICIIWVNIIGTCEYIQRYFLDIKKIIGKFIKIKKLN